MGRPSRQTGSRALVTGHSRGLGAGVAASLLERGVAVLGVSRTHNPELARSVGAALQETQLDLANVESVSRWLEGEALTRFFDGAKRAIVVNNAGLLRPIGPLEVQEVDAIWRAVAVNVGAVLALSAAFVRATTSVDDRRILHVSSGAGRKAYAGWGVYCATKAALDHHARAVALDRTPALRICSVAPGIVDTDMQAEIRESTDQRFPERPRFIALKREGQLPSPMQTGAALVELLLSDTFGETPVTELRR